MEQPGKSPEEITRITAAIEEASRPRYQPSNGTEGCAFMEIFCEQCVHEKFLHTAQDGDKQCDILSRSMIHDIKDPEYPQEWIYGLDGMPTCTAFKKHTWHDWDGNLVDPEEVYPADPNQLDLFNETEAL